MCIRDRALGVRPGRLAIFSDRCCQPGRCSQIAALPAITRDGHLYLARSYEYGFADELCLCVTRVAGSPAQAGFSLLLFGRMDGMNDRGLCVTMSTCSFLQPAEGEGLWSVSYTHLDVYKRQTWKGWWPLATPGPAQP